MNYPKITLKAGKEQSILRFHPWIFSGAIKFVEGEPTEGGLVEVYSCNNDFLAIGHFHSGSISVRILSFVNVAIDVDFWRARLAKAMEHRRGLGFLDSQTTNTYRLVHGEGDCMPGLVVDIYGSTAVVQCHSVGMYLIRELIANQIVGLCGGKISAVYDKSSATLPMREKFNPLDSYLIGSGKPSDVVLEHGCKFMVSWAEGQKTGFFIDQRENRALLQKYSNGKTVLNTFGYTGGFSVYAIKGGATQVVTVDSSEKAIDAANSNVELNFGTSANHQSAVVDTFEYLRTHEEQFDIIVLDPPAFAKHNGALRNALQAYKRLNLAALKRLKPGGLLFTFSCSQVVDKFDFRNAVFSACAISGRQASIMHQLTQPADHPINIYHPEGEYLKGLVVRVD